MLPGIFIAAGAFAVAAAPDGIARIPLMTAATTSGVTMSASSEFGAGNEAWKAGDRNNSTLWLSAININANLRLDLGVARTVYSYDVRNSDYQGGPSTGWDFQGANASDYSDAVTLDSRTNQTFSVGTSLINYTIASPASYRYYRWITTQRGGGSGSYSGFTEVQVYS